jgi:hypothetical protein
MPSIQNITNIPAPRVNFIDDRTGLMSREWYRFFFNLFTLTGGGTNPTSLEDLQLGPALEFTPDMFVVDNLSPDAESSIATLLELVFNLAQRLNSLPQYDNVVFNGALGTPSSGTVTNLTGTASININGTVGATTANTGSFTSLAYTTTLTGGTGIVNLGSGQFYKDASGNVGIGVTPSYRLHVAGGYSVIGSHNTATLAASSGTGGAAFSWNRSGGSAETNIANIFDNAPVSFEFLQKTGASTANVLYEITSTTHKFFISNVERMRIDSSGNVLNVSSGGLGYGTGSGGAVTQLTSRATGVTLNKTNGAITMFSAAGSATAATFTVTNSTVAATDTIILSVKSSTNVYLMFVTAVAAGSFNITFQTTGGVSTDAPVINFAVIKAVTA